MAKWIHALLTILSFSPYLITYIHCIGLTHVTNARHGHPIVMNGPHQTEAGLSRAELGFTELVRLMATFQESARSPITALSVMLSNVRLMRKTAAQSVLVY